MIGRLRGELIEIEGSLAVVDVAGVGYEVMLPETVLAQVSISESVELLTRQIFREDGVSLYGFLTPFQRRLFDLLLTVKACGPKASLALIGQLGEDSVASAILAQDAKILTRATGVGPKLAERITLELRDKIQEEAFIRKIESASPPKRRPEPPDELFDALTALGYRRSEIESIAGEAKGAGADVQEQIRAALRLLKK
ncbi:MAG TPA: Holliday junction branch migration protein RuvA [Fimbriimonas sp.]|nr:Holliday junction branch migration protein RuvA [Fimbriimonas sp.]